MPKPKTKRATRRGRKPARKPLAKAKALSRAKPKAAAASMSAVANSWLELTALPAVVTFDERGRTCVPPSKIIVGKRHRKDFGDIALLARSIDERNGLLHALPVTPALKLIAGERRLRAWSLSKFAGKPIPISILDVDSIVKGEWDENAPGIRKDFTPSEAVAIKAELEPLYKAAAEQRRREHGKTTHGKKSQVEKSAGGRAGDQVARIVGMDRRTLDKAAEIVAAADRDPEKFGPLKEQMDRTGKVAGPHKRLRVLTLDAEIRKSSPPLPMQGPYKVLAADVPWPGELDDENPAERGRAFYPYATMSLKAIEAMGPQVQAIADADCWLWFWIPNFHLMHGAHLPILKAWGFEPAGLVTMTKPHFGNGKILRGQTEQVILCRRGSPAWTLTNQSTWLDVKTAAGEHSEKPPEFFALVESLCPAPRYGYLFAGRNLPDNWDGHGDRVGQVAPAAARAAEAEMLAEATASKRKRGRSRKPSAPGSTARDVSDIVTAAHSSPAVMVDLLAAHSDQDPALPLDLPQVEPPADAPIERAADVRAEIEDVIAADPHIAVRFQNLPAIWEAFDKISHDSGAGCGYAAYNVPARWSIEELTSIEAALAELSPEELADFAIGESSDRDRIKARSAILGRADVLLVEFFEGFPAAETPPAGNDDDQLDIPAFLRRTSAANAAAKP